MPISTILPSTQNDRLPLAGKATRHCDVGVRISARCLDPRIVARAMSTILLITAIQIAGSATTSADDWPQINGPSRDGTVPGEALRQDWPKEGLEPLWSHTVGEGYSGPVVVEGKLVVFHRPGKDYLAEALDAKTGQVIWKVNLPSEYRGGGPDGDKGPKAVPLVHEGRVYLFGTGGNLFCLQLADGKIVWKKNVLQEYQSPTGYFGSGSSPIVVDGKLMLNVGGKNAAVVAFDPETGEERWKAFDDRASYSSPIEMTLNGKKLVAFITRLNLIGLDPSSGDVIFKTAFGKRGPTVNGAMPVNVDGRLFVNSAYGIGAKFLKVTGDEVEVVWENDVSFSSQYSTPVNVDGNLYGTAGREDTGFGSFRCLEASSGGVRWVEERFPVGHTLLVDGKLVVLDSGGNLHVINVNPKKFERVYQTKLFRFRSRAMPAISDGLMFARSNASNGKAKLICVRIGETR